MSDFQTTGSLIVELDEKSVADARSTLEEELSADPITVEAETSGRPGSAMDGLRSDGGMDAGIASGLESQASDLDAISSAWEENIPLNERRNYLLEELVELTEEGNAKKGGGRGVGGMLAGGAIAIGLAGALGVSKLIGFLSDFSWPELPDPPEINVPSEIPVDAPSSIPIDSPGSIPVETPDPLSVVEPGWHPLSVLKPDWIPIPVDIPDPLAVDVPDPLPVDAPSSIPVDAPSSIPVEKPDLSVPQPDWWPGSSGSGSGAGTGPLDQAAEFAQEADPEAEGTSSGEVTSISEDPRGFIEENPKLTGGVLAAGSLPLIASGAGAPVGGATASKGLSMLGAGGAAATLFGGSAAAEGGPVSDSQDVYSDEPEMQTATSTSEAEARGSENGGSNAAAERRSNTTIEYSPTWEADTRRLERTLKKDLRKFKRRMDELEREFRDAT